MPDANSLANLLRVINDAAQFPQQPNTNRTIILIAQQLDALGGADKALLGPPIIRDTWFWDGAQGWNWTRPWSPISAAMQEVLDDVPFLFYELHEGTPGTDELAHDFSGNGFNANRIGFLTLQQPSPLTIPVFEYSILGAGGSIESSGISDLENATQFSLDIWVYLTEYPTPANFSLFGSPIGLSITATEIIAHVETPSGAQEAVHTHGGMLNAWHHIAFGWTSGSGVKLLLDGVLVDTSDSLDGSLNGLADAIVSLFQGASGMRLSMVAFYATQLSDARFLAHYEAA